MCVLITANFIVLTYGLFRLQKHGMKFNKKKMRFLSSRCFSVYYVQPLTILSYILSFIRNECHCKLFIYLYTGWLKSTERFCCLHFGAFSYTLLIFLLSFSFPIRNICFMREAYFTNLFICFVFLTFIQDKRTFLLHYYCVARPLIRP